jgi:hypothetical protein
MKRTGLVLAVLVLAADGAAAQMRPVQPATVPDLAPVLDKACLPVAAGSPVAAGIAAAKSMGFAITASHGELATLQRGRWC